MRTAPFGLACLLLLSGCAEPAATEEPTVDFSELELETTATTGILRGVVVDEAIRPIAGATITLQVTPPQVQTSGEGGEFGFDGLEPGTYFLNIHKPRFFEVQQSVDVVAGVEEPPIAKVLLVSDGLPPPYSVAYALEGIIECGTSLIALCGGLHDGVVIACVNTPVCPPQVTNDAYSAFLQLEPKTPDFIQLEMVWESTQSLGTSMSYNVRYAEKTTYDNGMYEGGITGADGPSPLMAQVDREDAEDAELGNRTGLVFSIFSGDASGDPTGSGIPLGATVEQRYTFFIHVFYGYQPPEEWRFSSDGEPVPPA